MDVLEIRIPDSTLEEAAHPGTEESAWVGERMPSIRVDADPEGELADLLRRLQSCAGLETNWDSYGGLPPTLRALEQSLRLAQGIASNRLPFPVAVVPTSGGGLQFEWTGPGGELEVEILSNGGCSILMATASFEREATDVSLKECLGLIADIGADPSARPD